MSTEKDALPPTAEVEVRRMREELWEVGPSALARAAAEADDDEVRQMYAEWLLDVQRTPERDG